MGLLLKEIFLPINIVQALGAILFQCWDNIVPMSLQRGMAIPRQEMTCLWVENESIAGTHCQEINQGIILSKSQQLQ